MLCGKLTVLGACQKKFVNLCLKVWVALIVEQIKLRHSRGPSNQGETKKQHLTLPNHVKELLLILYCFTEILLLLLQFTLGILLSVVYT